MVPLVSLVGHLVLFVGAAVAFLFVTLLIGKLVRPHRPNAEKRAIYECGEPAIGSSWVQFDLRFYVVALLFVIFDVELAFFFPWAAVFGKAVRLADTSAVVTGGSGRGYAAEALAEFGFGQPGGPAEQAEVRRAAGTLARIAFADLMVFFAVILVGFAYLWKRGDIVGVRATEDAAGAAGASESAGPAGSLPTTAVPDAAQPVATP